MLLTFTCVFNSRRRIFHTWVSSLPSLNHETIIGTGIKSLVICATQFASGLLLKMLKYFKVMLKSFEFSLVKEIAESWFVNANKFSWIIQWCILTETIKKIKNGIVINNHFNLSIIKKLIKLFYLRCCCWKIK